MKLALNLIFLIASCQAVPISNVAKQAPISQVDTKPHTVIVGSSQIDGKSDKVTIHLDQRSQETVPVVIESKPEISPAAIPSPVIVEKKEPAKVETLPPQEPVLVARNQEQVPEKPVVVGVEPVVIEKSVPQAAIPVVAVPIPDVPQVIIGEPVPQTPQMVVLPPAEKTEPILEIRSAPVVDPVPKTDVEVSAVPDSMPLKSVIAQEEKLDLKKVQVVESRNNEVKPVVAESKPAPVQELSVPPKVESVVVPDASVPKVVPKLEGKNAPVLVVKSEAPVEITPEVKVQSVPVEKQVSKSELDGRNVAVVPKQPVVEEIVAEPAKHPVPVVQSVKPEMVPAQHAVVGAVAHEPVKQSSVSEVKPDVVHKPLVVAIDQTKTQPEVSVDTVVHKPHKVPSETAQVRVQV